MQDTQYDALTFARELIAEHDNDWGGSHTPEEIATSRYALVMERQSDSWVIGLDSREQIAACELGDPGAEDAEWVADVYDMSNGELVRYETTRVVVLAFLDGSNVCASA